MELQLFFLVSFLLVSFGDFKSQQPILSFPKASESLAKECKEVWFYLFRVQFTFLTKSLYTSLAVSFFYQKCNSQHVSTYGSVKSCNFTNWKFIKQNYKSAWNLWTLKCPIGPNQPTVAVWTQKNSFNYWRPPQGPRGVKKSHFFLQMKLFSFCAKIAPKRHKLQKPSKLKKKCQKTPLFS